MPRFKGFLFIFFALALAGCGMAQPRFSPDVQKAFIDNPMRRMETDRVALYYPEHRREEALRMAARIEECASALEERMPRRRQIDKFTVIMPEVEFNNAYVMPGAAGNDVHMVVPTYFTADIFAQMGMAPSPSFISCHEVVHYIQAEEVRGIPGFLNAAFGRLYTPQLGLDFWFWEGVATYYETALQPGQGRMASPLWRQTFASGMAGKPIGGGDLHTSKREIPFGAHYLTGAHFIEYLVDTYGEEKLWKVVDLQSWSIFFPLFINARFLLAYGKDLSSLIREFDAYARERFPVLLRPEDQRVVQEVGFAGQYVVGRDGTWALVQGDLDEIRRIRVYDARDQLLLEREFPDIIPPRTARVGPLIGGLSLSDEGRYLYFTNFDYAPTGTRTTLLELEIGTNRLRRVHSDIRGVGGDLTPDGRHYIYPRADGNKSQLARIDVATGELEVLRSFPPGSYITDPRVSPDGQRLAAIVLQENASDVWLFSAQTGEPIERLSTLPVSHRDTFWIDDEHLLYLREEQARFQVVVRVPGTSTEQIVSNAPYVAFNPRPHGQSLRFLNREGFKWTLDEIAMPAIDVTAKAAPLLERSESVEAGVSPEWGGRSAQAGPIATSPDTIVGYREIELPRVQTDVPYSKLDGLFFPRLRVPFVGFSAVTGRAEEVQLLASLSISGMDELGFHAWALTGLYETVDQNFSWSVDYANMQLAPVVVLLSAYESWTQLLLLDPGQSTTTTSFRRRDRGLQLLFFRAFYDIPLSFGILGFEEEEIDVILASHRRFVGAQFATGYGAGRASAYGGTQRLLSSSVSASFFPEQIGSDFSLADLRNESAIHTPLPLSSRHRLRIAGRARGLLGVPEGRQLMRVGGFAADPLFHSQTRAAQPVATGLLPGPLRFVERLRGFEDLGLATNQALLGDVNYRYPIIIDRGSATSLWFFPASFMSQINLELFGSAATFLDGDLHAAVGGSVDVNFSIWLLPFQLRYQLAQRLTDDEALVHTVLFGVGE